MGTFVVWAAALAQTAGPVAFCLVVSFSAFPRIRVAGFSYFVLFFSPLLFSFFARAFFYFFTSSFFLIGKLAGKEKHIYGVSLHSSYHNPDQPAIFFFFFRTTIMDVTVSMLLMSFPSLASR